MAAGLVEDHAAEAAVDDHGHHARRTLVGVQHRHRAARGFAGARVHVLPRGKQLKAHHRARTLGAGLVLALAAGDRRDGRARVHALIGNEHALRVGNGHGLLPVPQRAGHVRDFRALRARRAARFAHQRAAAFAGNVHGKLANFMNVLHDGAGQLNLPVLSANAAYRVRRALRQRHQTRVRGIVGVHVYAVRSLVNPQTRAVNAPRRRRVDAVVRLADARRARILIEYLGKIAAGRNRSAQRALRRSLFQHCSSTPLSERSGSVFTSICIIPLPSLCFKRYANIFCKISSRSAVTSASCVVPRSLTTYVQRP